MLTGKATKHLVTGYLPLPEQFCYCRKRTLIFSNWGVKQNYREDNPDALWGSYGYTPDRDVLRTSMAVMTGEAAVDQLTIAFINMSQQGGQFAIVWDDQVAITPFTFLDP